MAAIASGYVNSALCKSKYACPLRVAFLRPTPHHRNTDYRSAVHSPASPRAAKCGATAQAFAIQAPLFNTGRHPGD
jgi:hypothetical protein